MIDKSNRARAKNSKKTLKRLLSYFKGYRLKVAIVIFAAIFSAFANVFGTYYLSIVIDTAVAFDNYVDLIYDILLLASIYLLGAASTLFYTRYNIFISQQIIKKIRSDMFKHMQDLPMKYFDNKTHGEIMSYYTNDIDTLNECLNNSIVNIFNSLCMIIGTMVFLLVINIYLALSMLAEVTDGESRQQILDLAGADSIETLRTRLCEVMQNRSDVEEGLETNAAICAELQQSLDALEKDIMELRGEYKSRSPYMPHMIDDPDRSMQPSEVMKNLGNVLDWLTLIMPQGKIAGVLKSVGITKSLAKVLGTVEKTTKIIKSGKGIKDITGKMRKMRSTYATAKRIKKVEEIYNYVGGTLKAHKEQSSPSGAETTGLLDYLTIEHWAEQLGKKFDTPPRQIEDEEYKRQYMEEKASLEQDIISMQRAAHKKKCELNIYESKQARMEAERKAGVADEKKIKAELEQREHKIRAASKKTALQRWKQDCAQWYISQMEPQIGVVISKAEEGLPDRIMSYQQERMSVLKEKLNSKKQEYDALQQTPPDECTEQLDKVCSLLDGLKKAYHGC